MKITSIALMTLLTSSVFGQDSLTALTRPIVDEGKRLYQSEMASWYGTDIFMKVIKTGRTLLVTSPMLTTALKNVFTSLRVTSPK